MNLAPSFLFSFFYHTTPKKNDINLKILGGTCTQFLKTAHLEKIWGTSAKNGYLKRVQRGTLGSAGGRIPNKKASPPKCVFFLFFSDLRLNQRLSFCTKLAHIYVNAMDHCHRFSNLIKISSIALTLSLDLRESP